MSLYHRSLITVSLGPFSKISYWAFKRNPKTTFDRPRTVEKNKRPEGPKFLNEQNKRTTRNWNLEFQKKTILLKTYAIYQIDDNLQTTFQLLPCFSFPQPLHLGRLGTFSLCSLHLASANNSDWSRAASMQPP